MADNKKQTLENALKQIESQFGKGTIMKLGAREAVEVPSISTGSFGLDKALGIGGLPKGRVVEIYGPESSGKTTYLSDSVSFLIHLINCSFVMLSVAFEP